MKEMACREGDAEAAATFCATARRSIGPRRRLALSN